MKNNKAAGLDDIRSEPQKTDIALTVTILHPLLQQIWNTETLPDDWNEGILIPLPLHIIQSFYLHYYEKTEVHH
jgi:hypothetical protein